MKELIRRHQTYRLDNLPKLSQNCCFDGGILCFTGSIVRRPLKKGGPFSHYGFVYGFDHANNLLMIENNENGVECVTWEDFVGEVKSYEFVHYEFNADRMADILKRAIERSTLPYDLGDNNCEHFVNLCVNNVLESGQADVGKKLADAAISLFEILSLTRERETDAANFENWNDVRSLLKIERAPEFQKLFDRSLTRHSTNMV